MHHPTDRIAHTTAFVTPVVEHWLERDTEKEGGNTLLPLYMLLYSKESLIYHPIETSI